MVPALGPGLEGRGLGALPAQGGRARRPSAASRSATSTARWSARRRRSARTPRRCARRSARDRRDRRRTGSASRRRPPSGSASPAAARASPRSPPRRWCGREAVALTRAIATFGYVGFAAGRRRHLGLARGAAAGYLLHRLGGFPLLAAATVAAYGLGHWATHGRDLRAATTSTPRTSSSTRSSASGSRSCRSRSASGSPARRRALFPWPGWVGGFLLFRLFDIWKPGPVGWADRRKGPTGVMLDDVLAGLAGRRRSSRSLAGVAHGWLR